MTKKIIYNTSALASIAAALVIEILPFGAVLVFASPPGESKIITTYSFFSLTPIGYTYFMPITAGILTVLAAVFLILSLIFNPAEKKLQCAAAICSAAAAVTVLLPAVVPFFGKEYLNAAGISITALLTLSVLMIILSGRSVNKQSRYKT